MAERNNAQAENQSEPNGGAPHGGGAHEAPEGAPRHPLIDLTRDPNPGAPAHARDDED